MGASLHRTVPSVGQGQRLLCADIGGTNSRFAWFKIGPSGLAMTHQVRIETKSVGTFRELLLRLGSLQQGPEPSACHLAVMAVAGAVQGGGRAEPPNIGWTIDARDVQDLIGQGMLLLVNDFVAQAHATRTAAVDGSRPVKPGRPDAEAAVAVVGAGTGLGHSALVPDGRGGHVAVPAEAGHAAFAFYGPDELEYQTFLLQKSGQSYAHGDMVVSGRGLSLVHEFLTGETLDPAQVSQRLQAQSETAAWFARFYGRACRHYALNVLALGGVYVSGGVAAKNPLLVLHPEFTGEFVASPTYGRLLEGIPVWLNGNEDSGLWGAAAIGRRQLQVMSDRHGLVQAQGGAAEDEGPGRQP